MQSRCDLPTELKALVARLNEILATGGIEHGIVQIETSDGSAFLFFHPNIALGVVEVPTIKRPYRPREQLTRTEIIKLLEKKGVTEIEGKPLIDCYTYELLKVANRWKLSKVRYR